MDGYCLSSFLLDLFKRHARDAFPNVKHSHLIEGFARGFGFSNYAALTNHQKALPTGPAQLIEFSTNAFRERLIELGDSDHGAWPEHFGIPDQATRAARVKAWAALPRTYWTLAELADQSMIRQEDRLTLEQLVTRRASTIVSGLTGTGKSTLLAALLHERAQTSPDEVFVFLDDRIEYRGFPSNVHQTVRSIRPAERGEFTGEKVVPSFLHSATLVLGEARSGAVDVALKNWNRYGGGLATLHAASTTDALTLLGTLGRSPALSRVDAIVHMGDVHGNRRDIAEIRVF